MGLGTREILITLGILLIVAILLDGVRRVRNARSGDLRMGRRKESVFDESDDHNSELPTGKARVIAVRDDSEAAQRDREIRETATRAKFGLDIPPREPNQQSLNLGPLTATREGGDDAAPATEKVPRKARKAGGDDVRGNKPGRKPQEQPAEEDAFPVLVIHAMAPAGELYQGDVLLETLLARGMRYGDRRIFHRHTDDDGSGPVLFSMANAVKPGDFDLDAMAEFTTPGVTFLMMIADVADPQPAFNQMLEIAEGLVGDLGGELKDETRSTLTKQTIEHCRQRIRDYTRVHAPEYH